MMIKLHKIITENTTNKFDTIGNLPINLFDITMIKSINIIEPMNEKNILRTGLSFLSTISFKLATSAPPSIYILSNYDSIINFLFI